MVSERDVRATALLTIRQHGESAAYYAAGRADELDEAGAHEGARVWRAVLKEIERLRDLNPTSAIN